MKVVEREFTCEMCGKTFISTAKRARFCPDCRKIRGRLSAQRHMEKLASGEQTRRIGSVQICEVCGNEFILNSGSQRYCENCRDEYQKQRKREYNKAKAAEGAEYNKENYDRVSFFLPKGKKGNLKERANKMGVSLNQFITNAIEEYIDRLDNPEDDLPF